MCGGRECVVSGVRVALLQAGADVLSQALPLGDAYPCLAGQGQRGTPNGIILHRAAAVEIHRAAGHKIPHTGGAFHLVVHDFLRQGEQTDATEKAFIRTLADSILKDFCYKHIVRNDILNFVRGDLAGNADNFWQPDIDRDKILLRLQRGMDAAVEPVIRNLERSNFISDLSGGEYAERGWGGVQTAGYYFPWDRAFEIEMEILLGDFTEPHEKMLGVYYK